MSMGVISNGEVADLYKVVGEESSSGLKRSQKIAKCIEQLCEKYEIDRSQGKLLKVKL